MLTTIGYVSNAMPEKVLQLFQQISVEPDEVLVTILFNACAKLADHSSIKLGKDVLNRLSTQFRKHQKLMNAAVDMLMKFGDVQAAENLFQSIENKSVATYATMIQGR
jgi:hypothetical protein